MRFTTKVKLEYRLKKYTVLAIAIIGIALNCLAHKQQLEEINNYPLQSIDIVQVSE